MVAPVIDTNEQEQELLAQLDIEAKNLSSSSLKFGWLAMDLWHLKQEDFMEEAGGKERKALGAFISVIQEREGKDIDSRKTVSDRIRIAKHIDRETYGVIVAGSGGYEPTYHQIRACIFTEGLELDHVKTDAMIDWAVANKWPVVADIRDHRGVIDPQVAVDPMERHYKIFVKLSQTIMAETTPGSERYNAAKAVLDCWSKENNLSSAK
jgi:hypothetical protein